MSKGDRLSGMFWLVISLAIAVESYRLGVGQLHAPQPGFLPFFASLLLGVLSLSLLFSARRKRKRDASEECEDVAFNKQLLPKVLYVSKKERGEH
jgi:hypothetical protein